MSVRVWISNTERTADLLAEDLPEWLEVSAKGTGFFEWEARAFTMRVHSRMSTYDVGEPVRVAINGTTRLTGLISSVRDPLGSAPEYEVSPYGRHFKDVKVGALEPDDAGRQRYVFELNDATISQAATAALANWATNRPAHFPVVDFTAYAPGDASDPTGVWAPHGLTGPSAEESGWLGMASDSWTNGGLTAPTYHFGLRLHNGAVYLGLRNIEWLGGGMYTDNWWCYVFEAGEYENEVRGPVQVGLDVFSSWQNLLGHTSERVETGDTRHYVAYMLNVPDTRVHLIGALDMEGGSWIFCGINPQSSGVRPVAYAVWWADPSTQRISGRWLNKSIADLLKLIAMVSMRWLDVNEGQVNLVPRTTYLSAAALPDQSLALDNPDVQDAHTTVPGLQVQLMPDDEGNDDPQGLANFTEGRVAALQWVYSDQFDGVHRTVEAEHGLAALPAGLSLLDGTEDDGVLIGLKYSTDGERWGYKLLKETI